MSLHHQALRQQGLRSALWLWTAPEGKTVEPNEDHQVTGQDEETQYWQMDSADSDSGFEGFCSISEKISVRA